MEVIKRPLQENPGVEWDGALVGVKHRDIDTFGYQWLLRGRRTGIIGGGVTVVFSEGIILFHNNRPGLYRDRTTESLGGTSSSAPILQDSALTELKDPEKVLRVLDQYRWGEPPYFDLVCSAITDIKAVKEGGGNKESIRVALRDRALLWEQEGVKLRP